MTNLIASIVISLNLSTNWTGMNEGTNELGYVLTNHIATVVYEGQTNQFTLKSVPSGMAVWRPHVPNAFIQTATNFWFHHSPTIYLTNTFHPNLGVAIAL